MQLAAGLVIADRFRLVRPLGKGGMGAVWLAQHTGLDVPCAVKFIHEEAAKSAELRARFEREAKAAAQLRSPHVVQILDHGVWQGAPYIAMELLEGEDLGRRLRKRRSLSPAETLDIASQVGRALSKAHAARLVHRDLKPANIFLVRDDEREIAKVLDFGVAKVQEKGLDASTRTGAVLGTPFYMSPEQARGSKSIDHRSDLWALAVVVYQCLIGKLPFRGDALGDLLVKIIIDPLPIPSNVGPVPPGFDAWWERAAARDPADRYQTSKELTQALGLALGLTLPNQVDGLASSPGSSAETRYDLGAKSSPPSHDVGAAPTPDSAEIEPPTIALPSPSSTSQSGQASLSAAPTPMHQSLSVNVAPRPARLGLTVAAILGAVAVGSLGTFLAVRSGQAADTRAPAFAAPIEAATTAPLATTVIAAPTATIREPVVTAAAISASAPTGAPAVSAAVPGKSRPVSPRSTAAPVATAGPRRKTDFGF